MANTLKPSKKISILDHLVEGCGIRETERLCHVHRDTVLKTLLSVGNKSEIFMLEKFKNIKIKNLQADEIWTFVEKKDSQLKGKEKSCPGVGSQYVYTGMCTDSKLIPSFIVGKRTKKTTFDFIRRLKYAIGQDGRVQLTTDGYEEYIDAITSIFGYSLDYAQTIKHQGKKNSEGKYIYTIKNPIIISGNPNPKKISTSCVERQNLTMRMKMERLTRKTLGFSKKLEYLKAAVNLHFFHYNFIRNHMTVKTAPAVAAGIMGKVCEWEILF